jgi:hypothetical protein
LPSWTLSRGPLGDADLPDGVDVEDSSRAFIQVGPGPVSEAEEMARKARSDRERRIDEAVRRMIRKLHDPDPPFEELLEQLAGEFDLTTEEIRRAWVHTVFH